MKIYFAATAPGNETKKGKIGKLKVKRRLLSYYLIKNKILFCDVVFKRLLK